MKYMFIMFSICLTVLFGYHTTNSTAQAQNYTVREITVKAGDTVWDIAARNAHRDMDVREMVYALKELNHIDNAGTLVPGTTLKVPAYKDSPVRAMDYVAQN